MRAVRESDRHVVRARLGSEQLALVRHCAAFLGIGLLLYAGFYAASEALVYRYGQRNPFFQVRAAPPSHYDHVILGASHAMPLGFEGMNERLEQLVDGKVINLSTEGSGILPNRLILDYFSGRHTAKNVVYILDSFVFLSPDWNEDRLTDSDLLRAPSDVRLASTLWSYPWARGLLPNYLSGFAKINNPDRFEPDLSEAELEKFERVYRPIAQIDRQRLEFLYPGEGELESPEFERYLSEFESLVRDVQESGMNLTVVKPPTPERISAMLPNEQAFDAAIASMLARHGLELHDLSGVSNDPDFFYDSDHLNREGVLAFMERHLAPLLRSVD